MSERKLSDAELLEKYPISFGVVRGSGGKKRVVCPIDWVDADGVVHDKEVPIYEGDGFEVYEVCAYLCNVAIAWAQACEKERKSGSDD